MTDQPKAKRKPSDYGMDDDNETHWAIVALVEQGLVKDSGKRRNGQIVWVPVKSGPVQ